MLTKPAGWILVVLQLALLFYIAWTGPLVPLHPIWLGTYVGGMTLFFWSVWAMRGNKLNITPSVPKRSKLITTGPYRLIRHPMYNAMLIVAWSMLLNSFSLWRFIAVDALTLTLLVKITLEEKLLAAYFKDYKTYQRKTHRLIPFLY